MLENLRIVEIGESMAVQVCGLLLGELGADVLKIEVPGGGAGPVAGYWRRGTAAFANWNRGKRSLELDLASAEGQTALARRLEGADVLLHRFTPAQAKALGLDDEALLARYPRLVVCGITGSPHNHPDAARSDDEMLVQARSGLMYESDGYRDGPIVLRYPVGQWAAAHLAAGGILTRLVVRLQTGQGGVANTSILQGILSSIAMVWTRNSKGPMPNPAPDQHGPRFSDFQLYACKDGDWLQVMDPPQQFDYGLLPSIWPALADGIDIGTNEGLRAALAREPVETWLTELRQFDIACEPCAPLGGVFTMDAVRENGYVVEVDDPHFGRTTQPNTPYHADVPLPQGRPAPRLGEGGERDWAPHAHGHTVPAAGAANPAHPLAGVKVADFGMYLAGPLGPSLMGDLGADVIKVESLKGDRIRFMHRFYQAAHRSKRSLAIDLTRPEAQPILARLVGWADVVHHNMRFKGADKLGLSEENILKLNPNVVFSYVSAYGQRCYRRFWPGFDTIFTAAAGWQFGCAGEGNPPLTLRPGYTDILSAQSCFVASLALLYAQRTGLPGRVLHSSMLGMIAMMQGEMLLLADGTRTETYHLTQDQAGYSPWHRIYQAGDGAWLAVAAHSEEARAGLRAVLGGDEAGFVAAVARLPAAEVLAALEAAGVPCDAVFYENAMYRLFDDPLVKELGLIVGTQSPTYGLIEQPGIYWDMGDVPIEITQASPDLGQHSNEVMRDLGFSDAEIAKFREQKIIA